MSNVVFILGAGASKQAGAPLMGNFLDVANDLLRTGQVDGSAKESFERVFNAIGGLQVVHSKAQLDLNNIEAVFTAFELGNVIQRLPGTEPAAIAGAIADLKKLIVKTLEATLSFPRHGTEIRAPKPYGEFAAVIKYLVSNAFPTQTSAVITFNYDLAADIALYRAGLGPNYAVDNKRNSERHVDLLKLHGSLNWATERSERRICPIHLSDYLRAHRISSFYDEIGTIQIQIGTQLEKYFAKQSNPSIVVEAEPVIVPPSWNKADYHHALSDVWASAARHLSEAEHIFVIGYSLPETDSFFRHLFALGSVGSSALRNLVVFNPDPSVDGRFRSLLGPGALARYRFEALTFEQAIEAIKKLFPQRKAV